MQLWTLTHKYSFFISLKRSQCYLKFGQKKGENQILLFQLNREKGIIWRGLNLVLSLGEKQMIISRNGEVHLCGNFIQNEISMEDSTKSQESLREQKIKIKDSLQSNLQLGTSSDAQKQKQNIRNENFQISTQSRPSRQSSRLSTRTFAPTLQPQKSQNKKQAKQQKKQQKHRKQNPSAPKQQSNLNQNKQPAIKSQSSKGPTKSQKVQKKLKNGRYCLKALLQNISDEDEDQNQDQQFSNENSDGDDESNQDSQSDQGQQQQQQDKPQTSSESSSKQKQKSTKQFTRSTHQNSGIQLPAQILKKITPTKPFPLIIQQQQSNSHQAKRPLPTTSSQFQEKWSPPEDQPTQSKRKQQKIQQLTKQMKIPTKRPTI